LKDELLPNEFKGKMDNWMFGCDICQDVCPWNRFSKAHNETRFEPSFSLLDLTSQDWVDLEKETFNQLFKKSAVKRTKFEGLKRNIQFLR
jgi:epoxyqueuosine reductase